MMVKEKKSPPKRTDLTDQQVIEDWVGHVPKLNKVRCTNVYGNRYRVDVFVYYKLDNDLYDRTRISQSYFVAVADGEVMNLTQTVEPEND
ncbi:MAG: hypothetical protein GY751_05035 [Bacteroidetes bacterium]|nr:hypothetical protein [Bacteroidota bacterium]